MIEFEDSFKYFPVVNKVSEKMTSIIAITLNKKEGPQIWAGDELATLADLRQSSTIDKIYQIGNLPYLAGGAGAVTVIERTMEDVSKISKEKEISYTRDMEEVIKSVFNKNYEKKREETVMIPSGTTWEEYKTGKIKDNRELTERILNGLRYFEDKYRTEFLAGGKLAKDEEFGLSRIMHTEETGSQFYCIGSGLDRSDVVMRDYLERMKSEDRKNIPLSLGMRIVVEASKAARRNVGVGGTGQIAYIGKEGVRQLNSDEVRLFHDLIFDEETKLVDKETVDKAISGIIGKTMQVDDVLKELETKIDYKKLIREHYTGRLQTY